MKHIGLFEGIGGFSLAARWMGWETVAWCEWNPFGQRVLKHHFPEAEGHGDITKTDFKKYEGTIDILTGGFPCQPYSQAGRRLGKEDERHLWPEMLRAIREIKPTWVVGENVFGIINWNGGVVFNEVQAELEAEGYEVQPFVLPACAVNAPHRRDRVWFIAYRNSAGLQTQGAKLKTAGIEQYGELGRTSTNANRNGFIGRNSEHEINPSERRFDALCNIEPSSYNGATTHSNSDGYELGGLEENRCTEKAGQGIIKERERVRVRHDNRGVGEQGFVADPENTRLEARTERQRQEQSWRGDQSAGTGQWEGFPTQSPVCNGDDGLSTRLDGITFPKWRSESIKAGGNAIVPQVALQIFKAIEEYGRTM